MGVRGSGGGCWRRPQFIRDSGVINSSAASLSSGVLKRRIASENNLKTSFNAKPRSASKAGFQSSCGPAPRCMHAQAACKQSRDPIPAHGDVHGKGFTYFFVAHCQSVLRPRLGNSFKDKLNMYDPTMLQMICKIQSTGRARKLI